MDLTEQIYVQCINCHSNIFESSQIQELESQGPICENCLFYQSKLINQQNQQLVTVKSQLITIKNHRNKVEPQSKRIRDLYEYNDKQINILQEEIKHLIAQEMNLDNSQRQLKTKLNKLCQEYKQTNTNYEVNLQQYGDKVCQLNTLLQNEAEILIQIRQLCRKKQNLLGYSVLMQIYHIHFDDQYAFINAEAVTIDNIDSLLEIISYLIKKYNYTHCQINSTQNRIFWNNQKSLVLEKTAPDLAKKWFELILQQTLGLWKHIKQFCCLTTKQNYDCYVLPFKILFEPQLSINGKLLSPQNGYASFLKYFTHNIKYIISFDFDVQLRSIEKWPAGRSQELKSKND